MYARYVRYERDARSSQVSQFSCLSRMYHVTRVCATCGEYQGQPTFVHVKRATLRVITSKHRASFPRLPCLIHRTIQRTPQRMLSIGFVIVDLTANVI
jgi:hypothetical protein